MFKRLQKMFKAEPVAEPVVALASNATHTVYPEIAVFEDNQWRAIFYSRTGETMEQFVGRADSRQEAVEAATVELIKVQDQYKRNA